MRLAESISYNSSNRCSKVVSQTWRLIQTPPYSGAWNMALDESLLKFTSEKTSLPTLRLYSWSTPTLSLGYSQPCADVDFERLENFGWDLIRRPTGGRAILHADEFTYSLTAPVDEPAVSGSLLESYQRISAALQKGLNILGIATTADKEYIAHEQARDQNPVCFRVPSNFEITWNGKKLIGSAQARKSGGVLQHGSLPLYGDLARITQVLKYPSDEDRQEASKALLDRAITLKEVTGQEFLWESISSALLDGFSEDFGVNFIQVEPEQYEIDYAQELLDDKYGTSCWNYRI